MISFSKTTNSLAFSLLIFLDSVSRSVSSPSLSMSTLSGSKSDLASSKVWISSTLTFVSSNSEGKFTIGEDTRGEADGEEGDEDSAKFGRHSPWIEF